MSLTFHLQINQQQRIHLSFVKSSRFLYAFRVEPEVNFDFLSQKAHFFKLLLASTRIQVLDSKQLTADRFNFAKRLSCWLQLRSRDTFDDWFRLRFRSPSIVVTGVVHVSSVHCWQVSDTSFWSKYTLLVPSPSTWPDHSTNFTFSDVTEGY